MMAGVVLVGGFAALCAGLVGWFLGEAAAERRREKQAERERAAHDRSQLYVHEAELSVLRRTLAHYGLADPRVTGCTIAAPHAGPCAPGRRSNA